MTETRFRVLATDDLSAEGIALLQGFSACAVDVRASMPEADLCRVVGDYDALLVRSKTQVNASVIAAAKKLRFVGRAGSGLDNIDSAAAHKAGVHVASAPQGNAVSAAEFAIGLVFSLARHIPKAHVSLSNQKWEKSAFLGTELRDKTLSLLGLGHIGREVAGLASALKMRVIAHDPFLKSADPIELVDFKTLLKSADFLSVHVPLTPDTRHVIGAGELSQMKKGARIINAARGGIVDEQALLAALDSGHLAGAALDVFEKEPPPRDSPLLSHPKVIVTPHLGASTAEAQTRVSVLIAKKAIAFLRAL